MFGSSKIKLDPDLLRKVRMYARIAEAPSLEDFVTIMRECTDFEGCRDFAFHRGRRNFQPQVIHDH